MSNEPSENWDDDFLFTANDPQRHAEPPTTHDDFLTPSRQTTQLTPHDYSEDTAHSRFSFASSAWDLDDTTVAGPSKPRTSNEHTRPPPNLAQWSEANPAEEDTLDEDDFLPALGRAATATDADRTVMSRRHGQTGTGAPTLSPRPEDVAGPSNHSWTTENLNETNYDRDFEDFPTLGAHAPADSSFAYRPPSVASTISSSRRGNHTHARSSSSLQLPSSAMPGFRNHITGSPIPESAGSPSLSSFSALVSLSSERSRGSTNPLLPAGSSPPRARRRLRKKSRPQEFDGSLMEMMPMPRASGSSDFLSHDDSDHILFDLHEEDRGNDPTITRAPASITRRRSPTPQGRRREGTQSPIDSSFPRHGSPSASPPHKVPLLSRIGSMKRWRSRRASTASQDVSVDTSVQSMSFGDEHGGMPYLPPETPEPGLRARSPSEQPSTSSNRTSWIFSRASPATHSKHSAPPSPELKRSNSRPSSRFGRKRSTTVGDVLTEEDGEDGGGQDVFAKGKGRARDELAALGLPVPPASSSAAHFPKPSASRNSRRPLSLQPQARPSTHSSATSWIGSVGRSTSNPFVAAGILKSKSKENMAAASDASDGGGMKKRMPSSSSRRSPHKRSISLTSDPDDASTGRRSPSLGTILQGSPPPPVPRLPEGVHSTHTSTSSGLLPPIALSPPSPPNTSGRSSEPPAPLLWAPSTPPSTPPATNRLAQIQRQHSASNASSTSPRGLALLTASPASPGQSLSLGRGSQVLAEKLLADVGDASPAASTGNISTSSSVLNTSGSNTTLRRSSLGDLKIPARISMAQTGLRNNLGMLREFATKVDDIQKLQSARTSILNDIAGPSTSSHESVASSSLAPPDLKSHPSVERLEEQYALWWECAELLVELGGTGTSSSQKGTPPPPREKILSASTTFVPIDDDPTITLKGRDEPTIVISGPIRPRERQRSITIVGHEKSVPDVTLPTHSNTTSNQQTVRQTATPPSASPNMDSKGRNDLSVRQLALLKEMLETPDPSVFDRHHSAHGIRFASQPEAQRGGANGNGYGHPSSSAITLPSIPSSPHPLAGSSTSISEDSSNIHSIQGNLKGNGIGKGTAGKVKRLQRFRDMLRSLTNTSPNSRDRPALSSTSEVDVSKRQPQPHTTPNGREEKKQRRRKSTDPALVVSRPPTADSLAPPPPTSMRQANSPYGVGSLSERDREHKSPRRPSLASIFRIGQSQANSSASNPITPLTNRRKRRLRRKPSTPAKDSNSSVGDDDEDDYSDWDRMDSASDLEGATSPTPRRALSPRPTEQATIKSRRTRAPCVDQQAPPPVPPLRFDRSGAQTPTPAPRDSSSQISLRSSPSKPRLGGRLRSRTADIPPPPPSLPLTRPSMSSSAVVKPTSSNGGTSLTSNPMLNPADFKLALTPENIRPLLEYAKEVNARLSECISELRMVQARSASAAGSAVIPLVEPALA